MLRENDGRGVTRTGKGAGLWPGRWAANFRKFRKPVTAITSAATPTPLPARVRHLHSSAFALLLCVLAPSVLQARPKIMEIARIPKNPLEAVFLASGGVGKNSIGPLVLVSTESIRCVDSAGRVLGRIRFEGPRPLPTPANYWPRNEDLSAFVIASFDSSSGQQFAQRFTVYDGACRELWKQRNATDATYHVSPNGNYVIGTTAARQPLKFFTKFRSYDGVEAPGASWPITRASNLSFSPDEKLIAITTRGLDERRGVIVYELATGKEIWRRQVAHPAGVVFSNDANSLAVEAQLERAIYIFSTSTGGIIGKIPSSGLVLGAVKSKSHPILLEPFDGSSVFRSFGVLDFSSGMVAKRTESQFPLHSLFLVDRMRLMIGISRVEISKVNAAAILSDKDRIFAFDLDSDEFSVAELPLRTLLTTGSPLRPEYGLQVSNDGKLMAAIGRNEITIFSLAN